MKKLLSILLLGITLKSAAQNTGIGTATPTSKLEISGKNGLVVSENTGNWIAGNFGGIPNTGSRVVMGNLGGTATIGGHNTNLTAWAPLAINPDGNTIFGDATNPPVSFGKVNISTLSGLGNRVVITDNNGVISSQPLFTSLNTTSSNGITTDGANNTKLGGPLSRNTFINSNGNTAAFNNQAPVETLDQEFLGNNNNCFCLQNVIWQSFTADYTGQLSKITFRFYHNNALMNFAIHDGEGVNGTVLLYSPNVTTPYPPGSTNFTVYEFATPGVHVVAGQKYTFAFSSIGQIEVQCCAAGYPKGRNDAICGCSDYWFKTYILPEQPLGLFIGDGKVGINTTTPNYNLEVNGPVAASSAYLNLSDQRLKTNIKQLNASLEKILQLRGVTYNWDKNTAGNKNLDARNHIGFLAQEMELVLPQVVYTANDAGNTKSVAYGDIVPVLVQAIQQRQQQIEDMQRQIDALKIMAAAKLKPRRKK